MDLYLSSSPEIAPSHSLVIAAGGGRDLAWPHQRVAAELLARSGGRLVHLVLHGGARGADAAIGRAAHQLGWSSLVMPAQWERHGRAAGPIRNRELLQQAIAKAVAGVNEKRAVISFGLDVCPTRIWIVEFVNKNSVFLELTKK